MYKSMKQELSLNILTHLFIQFKILKKYDIYNIDITVNCIKNYQKLNMSQINNSFKKWNFNTTKFGYNDNFYIPKNIGFEGWIVKLSLF